MYTEYVVGQQLLTGPASLRLRLLQLAVYRIVEYVCVYTIVTRLFVHNKSNRDISIAGTPSLYSVLRESHLPGRIAFLKGLWKSLLNQVKIS